MLTSKLKQFTIVIKLLVPFPDLPQCLERRLTDCRTPCKTDLPYPLWCPWHTYTHYYLCPHTLTPSPLHHRPLAPCTLIPIPMHLNTITLHLCTLHLTTHPRTSHPGPNVCTYTPSHPHITPTHLPRWAQCVAAWETQWVRIVRCVSCCTMTDHGGQGTGRVIAQPSVRVGVCVCVCACCATCV